MTSNSGSDIKNIYQKRQIGILQESSDSDNLENKKIYKNSILKSLEKEFRPEFLSRLQYKVVFYKLTEDDLVIIIKNIIVPKIEKRFSGKNISIDIDNESIKFILKSHDNRYGVRNLEQLINGIITKKIIKLIISGIVKENDVVLITVKKMKLNIRKKVGD